MDGTKKNGSEITIQTRFIVWKSLVWGSRAKGTVTIEDPALRGRILQYQTQYFYPVPQLNFSHGVLWRYAEEINGIEFASMAFSSDKESVVISRGKDLYVSDGDSETLERMIDFMTPSS